KANTTHISDINNTPISNANLNMSDKNYDPSSISTKISTKSSDVQSIDKSSFDKVQNESLADTSKSTIITNNSKHLPSTLNNIYVGEILLTDKNEEQHLHSTIPCSSSKLDHATKNVAITNKEQAKLDLDKKTHVLSMDNDNKKPTKHLNPNAPDFKPTHLTSIYRSELAPTHLQRHTTNSNSRNKRHERIRYYSDTYHYPEPLTTSSNTSPIQPLLSIVPQYTPYPRQSLSAITLLSSSSSTNSWWPQEYSHTLCPASSYCPRPAYQLYIPLIQKQQQQKQQYQQLIDENQNLHHQQKNKHLPKRIRTYSGRPFIHPNQTTTGRIRSYSGPEASLQSPSGHLDGIHCLTRIMVDILRQINKTSNEQQQKSQTISSSDLTSYAFVKNKYQQPRYHYIRQNLKTKEQRRKSSEAKKVLADKSMSTKASSLLPSSVDKAAAVSNENEAVSTNLHNNQSKQICPLISNDRNETNTINTDSTFSSCNKQFYDINNEDESIKTISNTVPEASIENEEKERSGNRSQRMVKKLENEEQQKQHQQNSTFSSSSSSSAPRENTTTSLLMMNRQEKCVPQSLMPVVNDTSSMSAASTHGITTTSISYNNNNKKQDEQNNHRQNISSSNNRSSRSTHTTHTYASTNTFNTEPTYTTTPITGDPQTLHSCYVTSSNYHPPPPPTSPTNSLTRHYREYEPSYPSITRYRTPSSSSPFRKTHYLDDSDEEIINEEILEITDLNHYPTLIERWGDDTKTIVRQEGEFKFEDFVEFEETEPTVVEEILYELVYSGDKLKTCRQIDRSRSESRNFRKIKKRRTKRKRQLLDGSSYLTSQPSSRDTSGTRSPYYNDYRYSPERSSTPTQSSTLSSSWQSTGFIPNDKSSLDISIRNRLDDQNYVNYIRVNETDPFRSHTQVQYYPQTRITNHLQYNTFQTDLGNRQNKHFYDNIYDLPTTNDNTLHNIEEYIPVISEERGITKINLTPTNYDYANENLLMKNKIDTNKDTYDISSLDDLLTSTRTTDNKEQSRTNIIDQTSVQKEINNREPYHSANIEKQINKITASKYDELEKEDEEHSSTTEPTIREIMKDDETAGKDTDEDASFSDSEQIPSQSFMSDEQNQSLNLIKTTEEESHPSYLLSTNEKQDDHETISTTTTTATDSSINRINELETQLPTSDSIEKLSETTIDREQIKPMQTLETSSIEHVTQQLLPEYLIETKETSLEKTPETSIPTNISDEKKQSLFKDQTSSENDEELRSMLNSITAHLMPELPRYDDETEDEQSLLSEPKSSEEPISQDDQSVDSIVQKSIEDAKELWTQSHDQIGTVDQTK
ncbi:unnamed protein product, partial [Rotaria sordida]